MLDSTALLLTLGSLGHFSAPLNSISHCEEPFPLVCYTRIEETPKILEDTIQYHHRVPIIQVTPLSPYEINPSSTQGGVNWLGDILLHDQKMLLYVGSKNYEEREVYYTSDPEQALKQWLRSRDKTKYCLFYGRSDKPLR